MINFEFEAPGPEMVVISTLVYEFDGAECMLVSDFLITLIKTVY